MVQDTASIQSFTHIITLHEPRRTDLYSSDKIHGEGSAKSTKVQLNWQFFYKAKKGTMFSKDSTWSNAAKMGQEEWYKMHGRPFHGELSLVGMYQFWRR